MKKLLIGIGFGVIAACGGKTSGTSTVKGVAGSIEDATATALADIAKLNADYTCECAGKSGGRCDLAIVNTAPEDPTIQPESSPGGMGYEAALSIRKMSDSCWGKLVEWEDARALACLHEEQGKQGARPSCEAPVHYEVATVEPWWKRANACGKGRYLVTKPNPMKEGALLLAYCAEKREYDIEYSVGHITEWYVHGGVMSDRSETHRTDWYPNGRKQLEVTTGTKPANEDGTLPTTWTYYHIDGSVSAKGQRVWNDLFGPWEGYRRDGSLLYRAKQEIAVGVTVEWFDTDGKPVSEEPVPAEAKAILDTQASAN